MFFPTGSRAHAYGLERAKEACQSCPFRRPCLAYALAYDVQGVWGATSERERDQIRQEHGIRAQVITLNQNDLLREGIAFADRGGASAHEVALALGVTPRTVIRHRAITRQEQP